MEKHLVITFLLAAFLIEVTRGIDIIKPVPIGVHPPPGKYRMGRLNFYMDKLSNFANFSALKSNDPFMLFAISHLEHAQLFAMHT